MSLSIKNNNKKSSVSSSTTIATKANATIAPTRVRAITLHKYPAKIATKATTAKITLNSSPSSVAAAAAAAAPLLSPSVETTSDVDVISSPTCASDSFSLIDDQVELTQITAAAAAASSLTGIVPRKVFRTMPSFKIMTYQNMIALLTVLVCGLVTVNGLKCYMCGQYNEGVGSITPCLNYSEQYAHLYLKECSKKSEKYCVKYVSELSIVRDCATECAEKEIWETQTYCCTEDGCNGSNSLEATTVVIMLPVLIYVVNEIMNVIKQRR